VCVHQIGDMNEVADGGAVAGAKVGAHNLQLGDKTRGVMHATTKAKKIESTQKDETRYEHRLHDSCMDPDVL
jgi:hypothetical protein